MLCKLILSDPVLDGTAALLITGCVKSGRVEAKDANHFPKTVDSKPLWIGFVKYSFHTGA